MVVSLFGSAYARSLSLVGVTCCNRPSPRPPLAPLFTCLFPSVYVLSGSWLLSMSHFMQTARFSGCCGPLHFPGCFACIYFSFPASTPCPFPPLHACDCPNGPPRSGPLVPVPLARTMSALCGVRCSIHSLFAPGRLTRSERSHPEVVPALLPPPSSLGSSCRRRVVANGCIYMTKRTRQMN